MWRDLKKIEKEFNAQLKGLNKVKCIQERTLLNHQTIDNLQIILKLPR